MGTRLLDSFGSLYRLLEQPRAARRTIIGLLLIHTLLLGYSAYVHSPTLNEPGHLVAGLSHWKFGRFDVYNVNPPLVKMVAALPVIAVGCNEDWSGFYEGPGARPEMAMGEKFVKANGERSFFLFMIARWACIPFSWLGAVVCYLWARDLFGRPSGVLACAIWSFEPNILAHASLITPDAHATALGLAACYTFWRWLKHPTWSQAALTGVVLGLAELTKTTLILFYPLWPLMWLIYRLVGAGTFFARQHTAVQTDSLAQYMREAGMLALRMAIGLYILNLGYAFEGSFTPLKDFHFVSDLFTGRESRVESQEPDSASPQSLAPNPPSINRFSDTFLGHLPVPFPKNYLLGIDIQQKDFERYGRPSYLRGVWQDHGWWYYYLYACAIKVPLGLWALGFMAIALPFLSCPLTPDTRHPIPASLPTTDSRQPIAYARDLFILLFPPLVIFTVVSSKTGFSEHMRYVLPSFPFFYIAISGVGRIFGSLQGRMLTHSLEGLYSKLSRPSWRFCFMPLFSGSVFWLRGSSRVVCGSIHIACRTSTNLSVGHLTAQSIFSVAMSIGDKIFSTPGNGMTVMFHVQRTSLCYFPVVAACCGEIEFAHSATVAMRFMIRKWQTRLFRLWAPIYCMDNNALSDLTRTAYTFRPTRCSREKQRPQRRLLAIH